MKLSTSFASLLSLCAIAVQAMPAVERAGALPSGPDPAYTLSQAQLDSVLSCPLQPGGSYAGVSNPILLVPGTGSNGSVSWDHTYVPLTSQLGYQPCYVSPPPNQNGDIQKSVEYVVNAVHRLTSTAGKKIPVMGWSAGNLDTQLALTFFPSTRNQIDRFVSFAGDFRGTIEAYLLTTLQIKTASVIQQASGSHLLKALKNANGLQAIVPTTSIYSLTDEIVQGEGAFNKTASSYLDSGVATAVNVQAQELCGSTFLLEHSQELFNDFTYKVAKSALLSDTKVAKSSDYSAKDCSEAAPAGLTKDDVNYDLTILLRSAYTIFTDPKVKCEPALQPWAKAYDSSPDTCNQTGKRAQPISRADGPQPFTSQLALASAFYGLKPEAIQYFMKTGKAPSDNLSDFTTSRN